MDAENSENEAYRQLNGWKDKQMEISVFMWCCFLMQKNTNRCVEISNYLFFYCDLTSRFFKIVNVEERPTQLLIKQIYMTGQLSIIFRLI